MIVLALYYKCNDFQGWTEEGCNKNGRGSGGLNLSFFSRSSHQPFKTSRNKNLSLLNTGSVSSLGVAVAKCKMPPNRLRISPLVICLGEKGDFSSPLVASIGSLPLGLFLRRTTENLDEDWMMCCSISLLTTIADFSGCLVLVHYCFFLLHRCRMILRNGRDS